MFTSADTRSTGEKTALTAWPRPERAPRIHRTAERSKANAHCRLAAIHHKVQVSIYTVQAKKKKQERWHQVLGVGWCREALCSDHEAIHVLRQAVWWESRSPSAGIVCYHGANEALSRKRIQCHHSGADLGGCTGCMCTSPQKNINE